MWLTGLNFKIAAMLFADWWKETFYLLPSQLDKKPEQKADAE